jgi:hypothetical protein
MKKNAGRKIINLSSLGLNLRLRISSRFNGGRNEIITNVKYGKNELCNSTWHIRNSIA